MKFYYRISDNSYVKEKLPITNKIFCFDNFVNIFGCHNLIVVADNCKSETLDYLKNFNPIITNLGNAGSINYCINHAINNFNSSDFIYFIEDDYLHHPKAFDVLIEGMNLACYVTLYDHPDKYTKMYDYGFKENSYILKTKNSHWRTISSTCMTFGCHVKELKKDYDIWMKHTNKQHPHDYNIFNEINVSKKSLVSPIPGRACHVDLTVSIQNNQILFEEWVYDIIIEEFNKLDLGIFQTPVTLEDKLEAMKKILIYQEYKKMKTS